MSAKSGQGNTMATMTLEQLFNTLGGRTLDVARGATVLFKQPVFTGSFRSPKFAGNRYVHGSIVADSYGAKTGQHTFTIEIIASEGVDALTQGDKLRIKGRNLYANCRTIERAPEKNYEEKHARGDAARAKKLARRLAEAGY